MMGWLLSLPGKLAMATLALALAYGAGHLSGAANARAKAKAEALQAAVKVLRERNEVDDQISSVDRGALCAAMGLSDGDREECVRRLAQIDAATGNGGNDHPNR